MSCRNHAEEFTRRLHSKLTSLTDPTAKVELFDLSPPQLDQQTKNGFHKSPSVESDSSDAIYYEASELLSCELAKVLNCQPDGALERDDDRESLLIEEQDGGLSTVDCQLIGVENRLNQQLKEPQNGASETGSLSDCQPLEHDDPQPRVFVSQASLGECSDEEERAPRVRRCSSLKSGKTPPGTPHQPKFVRFADALGLDLADVRTFRDEVPKVPGSAYDDLCAAALVGAPAPAAQFERLLVPLFRQPGAAADFLARVRAHAVCLEGAFVEDASVLAVRGLVRVRNLAFDKAVHARYTVDGWRTCADAAATYVAGSSDGFSDRFGFLVYGHCLPVGGRLAFAVRFECGGAQYWDNNRGEDYCFECLPGTVNVAAITPTLEVDSHCASFYYGDEDEESTINADGSFLPDEVLTSKEMQDVISAKLAKKLLKRKCDKLVERNDNELTKYHISFSLSSFFICFVMLLVVFAILLL